MLLGGLVAMVVGRILRGRGGQDRILRFINRSRAVLILVAGASKAKTLAEVLEGPRNPQRLPIQLIAPTEGKLSWLVDAAAAGMAEAEGPPG